MKNVRISWRDQDVSILQLDPVETLALSTQWVSMRPADEPWVAVSKPADLSCRATVLSLSLDAFHRFSPELVPLFLDVCRTMVSRIRVEAISEIQACEIAKGNRGQAYSASPRLLRLIVPSEHVPDAKTEIEALFSRFEGHLVLEIEAE